MSEIKASDITLMRAYWTSKLKVLSETVDATLKGKVDGKEKLLIDAGLKLRHKTSQFLYTVVSVSPKDVILKTPEGKLFSVDRDTLEKEYELD